MDLKDPDIIALLASQAGVLKFFTLLFPGFFALLVYVPAAPNDAYAALRWTQANATSFNGDATRISVGGESAGGNLATVTAMRRQAIQPF